MKLNPEFVTWAYRVLLSREPESDQVVEDAVESGLDSDELLSTFLSSQEFRARHPNLGTLSQAWVWAELENFLLRVNLADLYVSASIIEGGFELAETKFIKSTLKPGDVAIDIGGNLGYYTMLFASIVGRSGRVFSFEPMPTLFESVMLSVKRNNFSDRVAAFNVALSSSVGTLPIVFSENSFNWGGAYISMEGNVPDGHTKIDVKTAPLSDFVNSDKINLVKIDVEGAEPLVVSGCLKLLAKHRPIILSEVHREQLSLVSKKSPEEYIDILSSIGYVSRLLTEDGRIGALVEPGSIASIANVVFLPR